MTNSASRWRKIAKNLPQDLIHYTARKKAAQNLKLHFIRIRHCDECICRWVWSFAQLGCSRRSRNIFCHVAHTTLLKEASSLLRFHFQRRSLSCRSKLIQVARWPLGLTPRFAVLFRFVVRPWRSERVEAVDFQTFLYEQSDRIISGPKHSSCGKLNWKTSNSMANNVPPTRIYLIDINYVTTIRS